MKIESGPEGQTKMLPEPVTIRFMDVKEGVVHDTKTDLMWAARDNGRNINWWNAKSYCESYRGGAYTDWRMPTQDELAGLYDPKRKNRHGYHVHHLIDITECCPWASETRGSKAAYFGFNGDLRCWTHPSSAYVDGRALPVRSGK